MKNIIKCFLTKTPNEKFYDFIKQLPDREYIYICIDNNDYNIPNYDGEIKIIKINNKICESEGFQNTHSKIKGSTSREKALYYFYKNNINYDYIWFIEEDVFIPTIDTIKNINNKYPDNDLLVSGHNIIYEERTNWHWEMVNKQLNNKISLPYSKAMICAIRCSKKLLEHIFTYALKYKTLFFCEVMFNTIALHNNLNIKVIEELKTIVWRKEWNKNNINIKNLYHPVKCIEKQYELRKYLKEGDTHNTSPVVADNTDLALNLMWLGFLNVQRFKNYREIYRKIYKIYRKNL